MHLGTFDGERKSRCRGYDEPYGAARALTSLAAITFFLYAVSLVVRAF